MDLFKGFKDYWMRQNNVDLLECDVIFFNNEFYIKVFEKFVTVFYSFSDVSIILSLASRRRPDGPMWTPRVLHRGSLELPCRRIAF